MDNSRVTRLAYFTSAAILFILLDVLLIFYYPRGRIILVYYTAYLDLRKEKTIKNIFLDQQGEIFLLKKKKGERYL